MAIVFTPVCGDKTVCADKLPGKSLWEHLDQGTLTQQMVEAAGHEFRRAHQFWSDEFRGAWSHGDAGTNNVIYDEKTGRARFIDFEICSRQIAASQIAARGRFVGFLARRNCNGAQPAVACAFAVLSQRLCKCNRDFRIAKSTCSPNWHGVDLVGRAHELCQPSESKTASRKDSRRHR
jgi:hypothetical protein